MKHSRRCILILLALQLCATAACGEQASVETETTTTAEDTTEAELSDNLPDVDMDGFELRISNAEETWLSWAEIQIVADEENGDLLNDAIYHRNTKIEERFNCKLVETEQERVTPDVMGRDVMAGDASHDVWLVYDIDVVNMAAAGYLMPFENLSYVNLDEPWWNPMATEVFNIAGKQYAAAGNFNLSTLSRAAGFIFNKEIYDQIGAEESIYDLVSEGKWTIDKMYDISKLAYSDLNGNALIDAGDRFGISGSWKELYNRLILGSGVSYITKDEDGIPQFSLPDDTLAIDKILRIYDLFTDQQVTNSKISSNVDADGAGGDFQKSEVLFSPSNLFGLENARTYEIDIGFIPTPKWDEEQEHYYAPSFGATVAVLEQTLALDRLDNVGIILEALSFDSQYNVLPEYKEVALKTKSARDDESAAMIDIIIDSISFEFGLNAWQDVVANPFIRGSFAAGNNNIASTLASMETTVNAEIEKLRENILD